MARNENIIVLGGGLEQRTNQKTGKQRFTVTVKAEGVAINLDPIALGAPVAQAIAHHLREKMQAITATASPATLRARKAAEMAIQAGKSWAVKRYGGGKMGNMAPNQSDKLFNDSGRFLKSIVASASKDGVWRINVAANRLDAKTATDGAAGVQRIWARLLELVPEFADMGKIMQSSDVVRARVAVQKKMITKANSAASALKQAMDAVNEGLDFVSNVGGIFGGG